MLLIEGLTGGLAAGVMMGFISHAFFKAGIFKSSLFIIDGTFVQYILRLNSKMKTAVLLGIPVHLFTSISFGIGYVASVRLLKVDPLNMPFVGLYIFMLWLSMLFVALPIAKQGLLGRKLGSHTWLEQLALHVIFGLGFWGTLYFL